MKAKLLFLALIALFANAAASQTQITEAEYNEISRIQGLRQSGKPVEELRAAVNEALLKLPDSEPLLFMSVEFAGLDLDNNGIIAGLRRLVELKPKNAELHGMLAVAYLRGAHDAEALAEARAALALDALSQYGNYALGLLFAELGEHQEASNLLAKVVSDNPQLIDAEYRRAISESNLGNVEAAAALLKSAAARIPGDFEIDFALARLLTDLRRWSEAEPILEKLLGQRPRNPMV